MTQERKRTGWIVGILVLLVAGPFLASLAGLLPWSPINCWTYEVDLHTGHIRYTRYFAFLKVA
ncbi:MAG: hypothetical protein KDM81_05270, partial [Verrucomicrobiae bacterium]|nr:hypothetical protein [Verrucomicrobiae bacterium]